MELIKFRIYDPTKKRMVESGATPTMLASFFRATAVLNVRDGMEYQQYTGLKDNNGKPIYLELHPNIGKEIYESDIVNVTFPNGGRVRAVIEWHQLAWCYKSLFALDDSMNSQPLYSNPYPHYTHLHCVGYQFELIGTVDENPKLLEETSGD